MPLLTQSTNYLLEEDGWKNWFIGHILLSFFPIITSLKDNMII